MKKNTKCYIYPQMKKNIIRYAREYLHDSAVIGPFHYVPDVHQAIICLGKPQTHMYVEENISRPSLGKV